MLVAVVATALFVLCLSLVAWPLTQSIDAFAGFPGLAFWIILTLLASAFPVHTTRGTIVSVSIATILAATALGGPAAGALVAAIGSTERRELRGETPWYGALYNHENIFLALF